MTQQIRAGKAYVELEIRKLQFNLNQLRQQLHQQARRVQPTLTTRLNAIVSPIMRMPLLGTAAQTAGQFGRALAGIPWGSAIAAIGALAAALTATATAAASFADAIGKSALQADVDTATASIIHVAAALSDTTPEAVRTALIKLRRSIAEALDRPAGPAAQRLRALGLAAEDLANLPPLDQLRAVAQALGQLPTATQRSAAAIGLLGRGAAELGPLLAEGASAIDEARQLAEQRGVIVTPAQAGAAAALNDALTELGFSFRGLLLRAASPEVMAMITDGLIALADTLQAIGQPIADALRTIGTAWIWFRVNVLGAPPINTRVTQSIDALRRHSLAAARAVDRLADSVARLVETAALERGTQEAWRQFLENQQRQLAALRNIDDRLADPDLALAALD